jgi:hypothetical protein
MDGGAREEPQRGERDRRKDQHAHDRARIELRAREPWLERQDRGEHNRSQPELEQQRNTPSAAEFQTPHTSRAVRQADLSQPDRRFSRQVNILAPVSKRTLLNRSSRAMSASYSVACLGTIPWAHGTIIPSVYPESLSSFASR